ncbi:MAG: helix-turn-helix transcriptional regulator [Peptococcaceae bacterium]|nr:helix-turn-helix transcriptional regulator [Peptococcaceae bacterium]
MMKLYEADNHILICNQQREPAEHRHMAAHIIVSMNDNIKIKAENETCFCNGVMIPARVSHFVETYEQPVLVFLYDGTTNVAREIKTLQALSESTCKRIAGFYEEFENNKEVNAYSDFEKQFLKQLGITASRNCVTDERIFYAMEYIRSMPFEQISCQDVADAVYLSQGRFSHLFKEQTGMTFVSYLVYQRILYAYREILKGKTITQAALEAGFASAAHFADVNRRVFGLSAGSIVQDLLFTKIS